MSEKRKDAKGRVLRAGESQRKDLIYQYRYTDIRGKRQTIYSSDLKELREKEKKIQKHLNDGIDYAAGQATVIALLERYIGLKQGVRYIPMTDDVYQSLKNILARRKKVKLETIVDGYSGLILLDKDSKPKVALHIENEMRWAMKKYGKLHPDQPLI